MFLLSKFGGDMNKYYLVLLVVLAGCANTNNNVWFKPGASTNDFEADKYACLQQSQQQQGGAFVNQYGGAARTGQVTNWNLYNSCMQARGWSLQDKSQLQAAAVKQQADYEQKKNEYFAGMKVFNDKSDAVCKKPEYAPILLKTACSAKDISFEQITDSSKITPAQKALLPKYRTEQDAISKETREYMHAHVVADADKRWTDYLDSIQPEIEKINLDLYKGVITWGEYNQLRKDLYAKMMAESRKIYAAQTH